MEIGIGNIVNMENELYVFREKRNSLLKNREKMFNRCMDPIEIKVDNIILKALEKEIILLEIELENQKKLYTESSNKKEKRY